MLRYVQNNNTKILILLQVKTSREVILCGGTIGSPQLLLLSGIGDKYHLQEMGISLRKHLPGVGHNLQGQP